MKELTSNSGHFLVLEGPDGSGKTTQLHLLRTHLISQGYDVVVAREPGGTKWGMKIREIFLEGQGELDPMAEVMLLLAAKAQVLREVILPAYNSGKIVLMDRYTDSLLAYQGGGRQLGFRRLKETVQAAELHFPPTFTVFIDTPFRVCLERIRQRPSSENNKLDLESEAYQRRVHQAYQEIIDDAQVTDRPHCAICGSLPQQEMHQQIVEQLKIGGVTEIRLRD